METKKWTFKNKPFFNSKDNCTTPYTTIDFNCDNPCSDTSGGRRHMCFFQETIIAHVQVDLGGCTLEEGSVPTTEHTVKKAHNN